MAIQKSFYVLILTAACLFTHCSNESKVTLSPTNQCVSILSFGGVGDGATDNAAAIKNALASLGASGGCIDFPAGKYEISSPIAYSLSASGADSVSLIGAGADATILAWPNAGGGLTFTFNGLGDSIHIRDLAITVAAASGGTGIALKQNYSMPGESSGFNAAYGILAPANESGLSQLDINNTQFTASTAGIATLTGIPLLSVSNTAFLVAPNSSGILLTQASTFTISNNTFGPFPTPNAPNQFGINVIQSGASGTIVSNQFEKLTTGIWLQAQSTAVNVQSNSYSGDTNTVTNQGTGNTVGGGSN